MRRRPAREPRLRQRQRVGEVVVDRNAFARERDRGRDQLREREFAGAVFLHAPAQGPRPCRARRLASAVSRDFFGSASPCASRNIVARRRGRRGLAIVDGAIVGRSLREMDHHEAAAADIAGARIGHRQRETDRDRGIDRIAAALKNFNADAGGALLLRHHHAVARDVSSAQGRSRRARETGATWAWTVALNNSAIRKMRCGRPSRGHFNLSSPRWKRRSRHRLTRCKSCGCRDPRSPRITALRLSRLPVIDRDSAACRWRRRRGSTC